MVRDAGHDDDRSRAPRDCQRRPLRRRRELRRGVGRRRWRSGNPEPHNGDGRVAGPCGEELVGPIGSREAACSSRGHVEGAHVERLDSIPVQRVAHHTAPSPRWRRPPEPLLLERPVNRDRSARRSARRRWRHLRPRRSAARHASAPKPAVPPHAPFAREQPPPTRAPFAESQRERAHALPTNSPFLRGASGSTREAPRAPPRCATCRPVCGGCSRTGARHTRQSSRARDADARLRATHAATPAPPGSPSSEK
jgi:hypothetical protein